MPGGADATGYLRSSASSLAPDRRFARASDTVVTAPRVGRRPGRCICRRADATTLGSLSLGTSFDSPTQPSASYWIPLATQKSRPSVSVLRSFDTGGGLRGTVLLSACAAARPTPRRTATAERLQAFDRGGESVPFADLEPAARGAVFRSMIRDQKQLNLEVVLSHLHKPATTVRPDSRVWIQIEVRAPAGLDEHGPRARDRPHRAPGDERSPDPVPRVRLDGVRTADRRQGVRQPARPRASSSTRPSSAARRRNRRAEWQAVTSCPSASLPR